MARFQHQRHKRLRPLEQSRSLVIACAPLRSNVNLSRIVRAAGCSGIEKIICTGPTKVVSKIARDGADTVKIKTHRTLPPVLARLRKDGYRLVGLEQATESHCLHDYAFVRKTALVVGNERTGLTDALFAMLDDVVEIPVWGLPYSYNVATSTAMAMYEYCRQFPDG